MGTASERLRIAVLWALLGSVAGCSSSSGASTGNSPRPHQSLPPNTVITCPDPPSVHQAVANPLRHESKPPSNILEANRGYCAYINTTVGLFSIRLRVDSEPKTVNNFVFLAGHGFYDGLTFFGSCPEPTNGACTQALAVAGDPSGDGSGGPGYNLPSEPIVGDYLLGAVAMADAGSSISGSQFFISKGDNRALPRRYSLFGQVTGGIVGLARLEPGVRILWVAITAT